MLKMIEVEPDISLAVEIPEDIKDRNLPAVLFGNSLAADGGMWDEVRQALRGRARMVTFDARGHGRSTAPNGPYALERLGLDMLAIMDALMLHQAIICGLSLGGLVAQYLAIHAPERIAGIVLANTASTFPPPALWRDRAASTLTAGMAPIVEPTLARWLTKSYQAAKPERTAAIGRMILETPRQGYAGCCAVLAETDLMGALGRISCPARILIGTHDPSTTPEQGRDLATRIPDADIVELDAAHLSAVEAPGDFAQALDAFMSIWGRGQAIG